MRDPDRTELALEVFEAVDADFYERALSRLLAHETGRRIFRERELRLVARSMRRFQQASDRIQAALQAAPEDEELRFILGRLQGLWTLARIGHHMIETFADVGTLSLAPIRDALGGGVGERALADP